MLRVTLAAMFALLAGCSCCDAPPAQRATYIVDDATARRIARGGTPGGGYDLYLCREECDVLAGHTDAGLAEASVPDVGVVPTLPGFACTFTSRDSSSWWLHCSYASPCQPSP